MVVKNMEASLEAPTATSVRAVPAKLLADKRLVINNQLRRTPGGKISFTRRIGFAGGRARVTVSFTPRSGFAGGGAAGGAPSSTGPSPEREGRPTVITPDHVNLGL